MFDFDPFSTKFVLSHIGSSKFFNLGNIRIFVSKFNHANLRSFIWHKIVLINWCDATIFQTFHCAENKQQKVLIFAAHLIWNLVLFSFFYKPHTFFTLIFNASFSLLI